MGQTRITSNQPHINYKQDKTPNQMTFNTNQVREQIKERIQYMSEGVQKFKHRNKIKTFEFREKSINICNEEQHQ